ncbi:MAG: hypothetical protein IPK82_37670 [Polyangiaceae bacterium]|nr:hypothetical protein [Polyangiaceae bacterium]
MDFCTDCKVGNACDSFANNDLNEASGIAPASVAGAYFVHNDSGDTARFFATNCKGDDLGEYNVQGADAVDWEDMARAPCGPKVCLYFGDIGDNLAERPNVAIYRVYEPPSLSNGKFDVLSEKMTLVYPDGGHDSEALLVHPITGEIALVTKVNEGVSAVYTTPEAFSAGATATLVKGPSVSPPDGSARFTGGSVHPEAKGILLRTYTNLFFYPMTPDQTLSQALSAAPCIIPAVLELQGEAVTFTLDGSGYVTVSEQTGQSLHVYTCD